jgi:hypothetical protein
MISIFPLNLTTCLKYLLFLRDFNILAQLF